MYSFLVIHCISFTKDCIHDVKFFMHQTIVLRHAPEIVFFFNAPLLYLYFLCLGLRI